MAEFPGSITPVNHVEPVPRRIRAFVGGQPVLDTLAARYVWEWPGFPQYYVPRSDVRPELLVDEGVTEGSARGLARVHGLKVGADYRKSAAFVLRRVARRGAREHGALRLVRSRRLVRGGRAGLRPSAQPVCPGRRDPLHATGDRRDLRRRGGRLEVSGHGVRDRSSHALLPQPDGRALRAPRASPPRPPAPTRE